MLILDSSWKETSVTINTSSLAAFYRQLTVEERNTGQFQGDNVGYVAAQGGILVTRLGESIVSVEILPNGESEQHVTTVPHELWYLPKCSFEESFQCLRFFGFPGDKLFQSPEEVLLKCRQFIERMGVGRVLTLEQVSFGAITFKLISGTAFSRSEAVEVLKFNATEFAAQREVWEYREYIKMFLKHQMLILGAF